MREFHLEETKIFSTGLRPYHKARRGNPQFFDLYNFKPTANGLVPYEQVTNPIPEDVYYSMGLNDEAFPFPQLFIGKQYCFVVGSQRIFLFYPNDWSTPYELTTYDAQDTANTKTIPAGGKWEFFDFWDTWFFTNGVCTVFGSAKDTITGGTYKTYVHDGVPISCGTDHKGRVLFGGFNPTKFWDSTWQTFWLEWYDKEQSAGVNAYKNINGSDVLMPVSENWIWWSSIGGGDALGLFFPALMQTGFISSTYGNTKPMILDLLKRNEQGFAPMPVQGKIYAMRNLGDFIIVFSEQGVTAIKPISSPAPTYSIKNLELGGIASRGAVAGNDRHLVYIDQSGMLIQISADLKPTPLGYREYLYPLLGTDITVSFSNNSLNNDPVGEFFISNNSKNFYLSSSGLSETWQSVKSAVYFQGATIGMADYEPTVEKQIGRIGIEAMDIGTVSGLKTLEWVRVLSNELHYDENEALSIQVAVDYRYEVKQNETWGSTGYVNVNNEGWVNIPVTALDHRINIKVSDYERADIDSIKAGFKQGDRRYKRSISLDAVRQG